MIETQSSSVSPAGSVSVSTAAGIVPSGMVSATWYVTTSPTTTFVLVSLPRLVLVIVLTGAGLLTVTSA